MGGPTLLQLCTAAVVLCTLPASLITMFSVTRQKHAARLCLVVLTLVFGLSVLELSIVGVTFATAVFLSATVTTTAALVLSAGVSHPSPVRVAFFICAVGLGLAVPLTIATFDTENGVLSQLVGVLDFAGCLTLAVVAVAASLILNLGTVPRPQVTPEMGAGLRVTAFRALAIVTGMTAWQLGSELVLDNVSSRLVTNQGLAACAGALGWCLAALLGAQLRAVRRFDSGVLSGSVAVLACSPWLDAPAVVVIALAAGALSFLVMHKGKGVIGGYLGGMLVPGVLGVVAAGIVANPVGVLYSGHTDLLAAQLVGFGIAAVGGLGGSWLLRHVIFAGWKPPVVGDAGLEPTTSSV